MLNNLDRKDKYKDKYKKLSHPDKELFAVLIWLLVCTIFGTLFLISILYTPTFIP